MKNITVCADDFSQNLPISHGIIELCQQGLISATSCMTNLDNWPKHERLLHDIKTIDKGVHLNFTYGSPLDATLRQKIPYWPKSLATLSTWLITKQLALSSIKQEIERQLIQFEQQTNQLPDFIDGHQHVHHFPIIKHALLDIYLKKYAHLPFNKKPYIRISACSVPIGAPFWLKKKVIELTGSNGLKRHLIQHQLPYNHSFSGVYPFKPNGNFAQVIENAFSTLKNNGLLMCHPALESHDPEDPIKSYRFKEYHFFSSQEFSNMCKKFNIKITRFHREEKIDGI
jgi:chitin disaccharide deacetylase